MYDFVLRGFKKIGFVLIGAGVGCSPQQRSAEWTVRFEDAALAERSAVVETAILEGGCDGTTLLYSVQIGENSEPSNPPKLDKGSYGFRAEARDSGCVVFAAGCTDVELPLDSGKLVEVVLAATAESAACSADDCSDGFCDSADAGLEGGTDGTLGDGEVDGDTSTGGCPASCDGDVLNYCVDSVPQTYSCILGCTASPSAFCLVPSNVEDRIAIPAERGVWTIPASETWTMDTDTGLVQTGSTTIRAAGEGIVDGVLFQLLDPIEVGGSSLGVFVLESLTVESAGTLTAEGSHALVLLVHTFAQIDGTVDVSAKTSPTLQPGPGGASGAPSNTTVDANGVPGEGAGAGLGGQNGGGLGDESGGGGASFGGDGGRGGNGQSLPGGPAGPTYGVANLVPLVGGSGGGSGADNGGGGGGHGGGAIQISAGERITVSSTGVLSACGMGGRAGTMQKSAGGAGSGGAILLEAPTVENNGKIAANGGAGGQAASEGGGGTNGQNGADGSPDVVPAPGSNTHNSDGGGGGAGSGESGNAANGLDTRNGGGGGAGSGRIRFNRMVGNALNLGVTPTIASGRATLDVLPQLP